MKSTTKQTLSSTVLFLLKRSMRPVWHSTTCTGNSKTWLFWVLKRSQKRKRHPCPHFQACTLLYLLGQDVAENKPHSQRSHFKPSHMCYSSPEFKFLAVTTWPLLLLPLLHSKHGQPLHSKKHTCPFTIFLLIFISCTYPPPLWATSPTPHGEDKNKPNFFIYCIEKAK